MIMPKMKVLYRMSRAVRRFPEAHNQRSWHNNPADDDYGYGYGDSRAGDTQTLTTAESQEPPCGTTLCGAGWIAFQNAPDGSYLRGGSVVFPDGTERSIKDYAAKTAGLSDGQAEAMFIYASTADDLDAMIDVLESNPDATEYELKRASPSW